MDRVDVVQLPQQNQGTASVSPGRRMSFLDRLHAHLSRETSSGRFIPEMDGLRFVAIAMVVLFHMNGYLAVKSVYAGTPHTSSDELARIALVGFRGVELFFVISGFILALPFAAHHLQGAPPVPLRKYYLRRLARLEPPYFLALIVLFVLALAIQGQTVAALTPHLWASLVYLHNLVYGAPSAVMGVAWSLEIEVQFYLLVPLLTQLFLIRKRTSRRACIVAIMGLVLLLQFLLLRHSPRASLSILAFLQYFLAGFLLADIFVADWKGATIRNFAWDVVALAGWPVLFFILRSPQLTHWLFPFWILLLYGTAFRGILANRFFANRWITAIGGMCYSIYLLHYEVISAVGRFTGRLAAGAPYSAYLLIQFFVVGAAVLVVCGGYFVAIEKPCMRRDWPQHLWAQARRLFSPRPRPCLESDGSN